MGLRRREPDIKPYEGRVEWYADRRLWIITVQGWQGAPSFYLEIEDVFDREVLSAHLFLAGLEHRPVSFVGNQECRVALTGRLDATASAGKLLAILRAHYNHFKGRPIHWMRLPGRPR